MDHDERDKILTWISLILDKPEVQGYKTHVAFGRTVTMPIQERGSRTYQTFKEQCYRIAEALDEPLLVFLIVSWVLQSQLSIGDVTSVEERIQRQKDSLAFTESVLEEEFVFTDDDREGVDRMKEMLQASIANASENAQQNYDMYAWFCEKVVALLLQEDYRATFEIAESNMQ